MIRNISLLAGLLIACSPYVDKTPGPVPAEPELAVTDSLSSSQTDSVGFVEPESAPAQDSCSDQLAVNGQFVSRLPTLQELVDSGVATRNPNGSITYPARASKTLAPIPVEELVISIRACPASKVTPGPNFPLVGQGSGQVNVSLSRVGGATQAYRLEEDQPVLLGRPSLDPRNDPAIGLKRISGDEFYQAFVVSPGGEQISDSITIPLEGSASGRPLRVTVSYTSPSGQVFSAQAVLE